MSGFARRRIAVLTTGRQDFGILRSTVACLQADTRVELQLWVGGMHLSPAYGPTVELLEKEGFPIDERIDFLSASPDPVVDSARALTLVGEALARRRPDVLLIVGDRSETIAAGLAAALRGITIAHLHGGEETEGAVDNALRHALTKLSHFHFVAHEVYGRRVRQMGEPATMVHVVGPPGLDTLFRADLPGRDELESFLGMPLSEPVVVVTVHPTTLGDADVLAEVRAVTEAMERTTATYVITEPNADAGGVAIRDYLHQWAAQRQRVRIVKSLGELRYFGLLRLATAVMGNSSSGLIEAPALNLAVVNVGDRQKGRLRSAHIRDTAADAGQIAESLRWALAPTTRADLSAAARPFPLGPAGQRVAEILATAPLPRLARKAFVDWRDEG